MKKRVLGTNGPEVSAIGYGCMGLSEFYGNADYEEAKKTILKALSSGITYLDTADCYGNGANEELIGDALKDWHEHVFIASKFGIVRKPGVYERTINGRPEYVRQALEASLRRLKVDTIDLYYYHRIDLNTPIEETIGAMADLVKEGKIRYIGISEASGDTLRRANNVYQLTAGQYEYSLITRKAETSIFPVLRELGIGFTAYSPLGRGLLSGKLNRQIIMQEGDFRNTLPRMHGDNFTSNQRLVNALTEIAAQKGITAAQLSLAWILSKGEGIIPIPGTRKTERLLENIEAVEITLGSDELKQIEDAIPVDQIKGERYTEAGFVGMENY